MKAFQSPLGVTAAAVAAVALTWISAAPSASSQPVQLEVDYQTGKRYLQETEQAMDITLNIAGQALGTSTNMTQRTAIEVTAREEGEGKLLTMTYEGIKMDSSAMGQRMAYDSDKPDEGNQTLAAALGSLLSESIQVEVDGEGEVVAFRGPGGAAGDLVPEGQVLQMIRGGISSGLPQEPVSPGDSWTHSQSTELPQMGSLEMEATFTFDEIKEVNGRQLAIVSYDGTLTGGEAPADSQLPMTFGDDGVVKGVITIDVEAKQLLESETSMSFTMKLGGQEVPAKANNQQRLLSVEDL